MEIGGTTWLVGRWDADTAHVLATSLTGDRSPADMPDLRAAVRRAVADAGSDHSVGVAFPGAVDTAGRATGWLNRSHWAGCHLPSVLGQADGTRMEILDDGEAALRGETSWGSLPD